MYPAVLLRKYDCATQHAHAKPNKHARELHHYSRLLSPKAALLTGAKVNNRKWGPGRAFQLGGRAYVRVRERIGHVVGQQLVPDARAVFAPEITTRCRGNGLSRLSSRGCLETWGIGCSIGQHRPDLFVGVVLEVLGGIRIERRVVMVTEYLQ
jgi:hypothetical protein